MNFLSNLDETYTYREYSLAPTDDLIGFWRSKVRVTTGHWGGAMALVSLNTTSALLARCWCVLIDRLLGLEEDKLLQSTSYKVTALSFACLHF